MFDRRLRKNFWLTEKPHATGTLKNYAFPFCRPQTVTPLEIPSLPFKYVLLSHGGEDERKLFSNVAITPDLSAALDVIVSLGSQDKDTFATDPKGAHALLAALDEAKAAFAAAPRAEAAKMLCNDFTAAESCKLNEMLIEL